MVPGALHEKVIGQMPPQGGPLADREATTEKTGWKMCLPSFGGCNVSVRIEGGEDLHLPPPELSCTVCCDLANYLPVPGGKAEAGAKAGNKMVRTGRFVFGGDTDGGPGGGTYEWV